MNLKSPWSWVYLAVILYLVSMLVFVSIDFFVKAGADKVSAFGSVLGGVGTIFASLVAIYLFQDWKVQKRYDLNKELAIKALTTLLDFTKSYSYLLDDLQLEIPDRDKRQNNANNLYILQNRFLDEYALLRAVNSENPSRQYVIDCKPDLNSCFYSAEFYEDHPTPLSHELDNDLRAKIQTEHITNTMTELMNFIKVK